MKLEAGLIDLVLLRIGITGHTLFVLLVILLNKLFLMMLMVRTALGRGCHCHWRHRCAGYCAAQSRVGGQRPSASSVAADYRACLPTRHELPGCSRAAYR